MTDNPAEAQNPVDGIAEWVKHRAIIRSVNPSLFSSAIVAIYRDHLVFGKQRFWRAPLTDEMWSEGGEEALKESLRSVRVVRFPEVISIQEQRPCRERNILGRSMARGYFRFKLEVKSQKPLCFRLLHDQAAHVRRIFLANHGTSYASRMGPSRDQSPGLGCVGVFLLVFGLMALFVSCSVYFSRDDFSTALVISIPAILATCLGGFLTLQRPGKSQPVDLALLTIETQPSKIESKRDRSRSQPFRSKWLGIGIQICGLIYLLIGLSPLFDDWSTNNFQFNAFVVWVPATLAIYFGYRIRQVPHPIFNGKSFEDWAGKRSVVYLRPFIDDDSVTLRPAGYLSRFTGLRGYSVSGKVNLRDIVYNNYPIRLLRMLLNRDATTAEDSICRFLSQLAPSVAIGRPGQKLASTGASRIYVPDDQWKTQILGLLANAEAVVIQPGRTSGVEWELEQVRAQIAPERVLLYLGAYMGDPQGLEEVTLALRRTMGVDIPPSLAFRQQPVFVMFNSDWQPIVQPVSYLCPIYWPAAADGVDFKRTLGPFLQRIRDGKADQQGLVASEAKWGPGIRRLLASPLAIGIALLISLLPVVLALFLAAMYYDF